MKNGAGGSRILTFEGFSQRTSSRVLLPIGLSSGRSPTARGAMSSHSTMLRTHTTSQPIAGYPYPYLRLSSVVLCYFNILNCIDSSPFSSNIPYINTLLLETKPLISYFYTFKNIYAFHRCVCSCICF